MIILKFFFYLFLFLFIMGMVKVIALIWRFRDIIKQIRKGQNSGQSGFGSWTYTNYTSSTKQQDESAESKEFVSQGNAKPKKQIISEDEGEYVDFEEVEDK